MRVFLSGPINACTYEEMHGWRETAKWMLPDVEWVDPTVRDYRGREASNEAEIVQLDLDDIEFCDYMLVMAERPSWGTAMEIVYAHKWGITIVAITGTGNLPPSPWLVHHVHECVDSLNEAIAFLMEDAFLQ